MNSWQRINKKAMLMLLLLGVGVLLPMPAPAETDIFKNFSFDDCDPFEARALMMAVNGKKTQLVAAEQIIHVVNLSLGNEQLVTELTDSEGHRLDFSAFNPGQWVHVKGFKHINGGVVALRVQRIDPPESKKPVVRTISKESRRYKRIKQRVSGLKN